MALPVMIPSGKKSGLTFQLKSIDEFTTLLWHEIREKAILSRFAAVAHLFFSLMALG